MTVYSNQSSNQEPRLRLPEDFDALRRRNWFIDCLILGAFAAVIVDLIR